MSDPHTSWQGHYSFAGYRADESWRGTTACCRYEITPILDVMQLPQYHYLSFDQACQLASYFPDHDQDAPLWLKAPDFYLPSANIKYAIEKDPKITSNPTHLLELSSVIGVSPEDIRQYVLDLEEKEANEQGQKAVLLTYKGNLAKLTIAELKSKLQEFGVTLTRQQTKKVELLIALDQELKRQNISICDFMNDC